MKVTWLVAGIGDITIKRVIPAIQAEPNSRLAGVVTRGLRKAEMYGCPAWPDLTTALGECDAVAVYIATPVVYHAPQTIEALRAGRHVLCEKPVGMNYGEACAMRDVQRETGRRLGIAYYRRLFGRMIELKARLAAGEIGRPVFAWANCHSWFPPQLSERAWLFDPEMAGGGPLYDIASHRIDLMNWLFGQPRRVAGQRSNVVHTAAVEDNATVMIEYDGGVRAVVDVRWHSREARDEFKVTGTDGEIDLSPLSAGAHPNVHYPLVEDFAAAVMGGRPPVCPIDDALLTDWVTAQVVRG